MSEYRIEEPFRPYIRGPKLISQLEQLMELWEEPNASVAIRRVLQEAVPKKLRELGLDPNQVQPVTEAVAPPSPLPSPPRPVEPKQQKQDKPKASELQALRSIRNLPESDFS